MQTQVTFRHVEPSDALRDYATEKIGKVQKFLDGTLEANITLSVEKHRHEADVVIVANGYKIHSKETTGDLYSAIDLVTDKLEKQVKRYREKLKKTGRSPRKASDMPLKMDVFDSESIMEEEFRVIKSKRLTAKPMDIDEAAMQLDLSDDDFLVFINERSESMNVIYRRADGHFGLIEPE